MYCVWFAKPVEHFVGNSRTTRLAVNLDKSNIIVFRNGGHIASCEKWVYGENVMTVVNQYKYLVIYLSTRLTVSHAWNDMAQRAKKSVVGIFKLLWSLGERSPSMLFV